jgi:hypothetical protein
MKVAEKRRGGNLGVMNLHLAWRLAIADAQRDNFAPLIELLRRNYFPPQPNPPDKESWLQWQDALAVEREGRLMLAELLSRSTGLKKKRGAQPVPLFKRSAEESYKKAAEGGR